MSEMTETKICPLCAETIKAAAKRCPFCQTNLGRFVNWSQDLGPGLIIIFFLSILVILLERTSTDEPTEVERQFGRYRNELKIGGIVWSRPEAKAVSIQGVITNRADRPWRIHALEVRVLDHEGRILDARHPELSDPFIVHPHREHPFSIIVGGLAITNSPINSELSVHIASDGNHRFDPD